MHIELLEATVEMADAISEIYLASRKAMVSCAPLVHSDDEVRRWIKEELIPRGGVFVARTKEGSVVGMMAVSHDGEYAWLDHLYVDPGVTGQRIGSMMLDHARNRLKDGFRLYTFQENGLARRFYEKRGFRAIAFSDGAENEERCPDVLYEWRPG